MLINQKTKGMRQDTCVSICKPTRLITDQVTSELTERKSMGYFARFLSHFSRSLNSYWDRLWCVPSLHSEIPPTDPSTSDENFTDWLFVERDNPNLTSAQDELEAPAVTRQPQPISVDSARSNATTMYVCDPATVPLAVDALCSRSQPPPARPLHQQAISSISATHPSTTHKRQRSSSPGSGSSSKRHLPDRPRAMRDDGTPVPAGPPLRVGRLLDRVGPRQNGNGPRQGPNNMHHQPPMMAPMNGGFPPGMDPAAMAMMQQQGFNPAMMGAPGFPNGLEATMMALQQFGQLAMQMGLVGGPMMAPGMPFNGPPQGGNRPNGPPNAPGLQVNNGGPSSVPSIAAPTPTQPFAATAPLDIPTRPLSPTLCKFVANCNNPTCRYSHPSPVATMESGVVLSTEPCPKGISCDDPDCVNAHVSKAAKNPGNAPQRTSKFYVLGDLLADRTTFSSAGKAQACKGHYPSKCPPDDLQIRCQLYPTKLSLSTPKPCANQREAFAIDHTMPIWRWLYTCRLHLRPSAGSCPPFTILPWTEPCSAVFRVFKAIGRESEPDGRFPRRENRG